LRQSNSRLRPKASAAQKAALADSPDIRHPCTSGDQIPGFALTRSTGASPLPPTHAHRTCSRINNCGSFHFTSAGCEFSVTDLGGNDGGGTTGPWLAPWELPNTITRDDRPPVVPPPPPAAW
jgi:hypothetical protein